MALEGDTFSQLKKLARDYQEIKNAFQEENIVVNFNSDEKLNRISKLARIIENPELSVEFAMQARKIKQTERLFDLNRGYSIDRQAVLVWQNGGKIDQYQKILALLKNVVPFDKPHVVVKNKLQDAIDCCLPNDILVLAPGEYDLENLGDLATCLSIFGISNDPSKIRINLNSGYGYEVVLSNGYVSLEGVTVTSKCRQGGFWLKNGASIEVKDCRMVSNLLQIIMI